VTKLAFKYGRFRRWERQDLVLAWMQFENDSRYLVCG
jgi:hypothetical protein